jgi:mRNA deadenylase 3'-5' endonuclease subunit Ccr4
LTLGEFANNLWRTFLAIAKDSNRIDIIFDLYFQHSIKSYERQRRADDNGFVTTISRSDQPLPIEMNCFWCLAENKKNFQQFFVKWTTENYDIEKPIYLGEGILMIP